MSILIKSILGCLIFAVIAIPVYFGAEYIGKGSALGLVALAAIIIIIFMRSTETGTKPQHVNRALWTVVVILVSFMLIKGYKVYNKPTSSDSGSYTPPVAAPAPEEAKKKTYHFAKKQTQMQVPLKEGEWSGIVVLPPDTTACRISSGEGNWHERLNWNGKRVATGPQEVTWRKKALKLAVDNSAFRLRGTNGATATVIIDRKSVKKES